MTTFDHLRDEQYISLTTFRRDGTPVPTAVWFALHDGKLVITTIANTGKVKRVKNRGDVTVAPSTRTGATTGPAQPGRARVIAHDTSLPPYRALKRKYGVLLSVIMFIHTVRRSEKVLIEVEPG